MKQITQRVVGERDTMKPATSMIGRGKLPSAGSLLVGILVGLLVASVSLRTSQNERERADG